MQLGIMYDEIARKDSAFFARHLASVSGAGGPRSRQAWAEKLKAGEPGFDLGTAILKVDSALLQRAEDAYDKEEAAPRAAANTARLFPRPPLGERVRAGYRRGSLPGRSLPLAAARAAAGAAAVPPGAAAAPPGAAAAPGAAARSAHPTGGGCLRRRGPSGHGSRRARASLRRRADGVRARACEAPPLRPAQGAAHLNPRRGNFEAKCNSRWCNGAAQRSISLIARRARGRCTLSKRMARLGIGGALRAFCVAEHLSAPLRWRKR